MAAAQFIRAHAPPGTLATLTGLTGGAHAGFGKGVGGLAGGVIIEVTKNTKVAFFYFGLFSFTCSGLLLGVLGVSRLCCKKPEKKLNSQISEEEEENERPFLATGPNSDEGDEELKSVKKQEPVMAEIKEDELEAEVVLSVRTRTFSAN